MTLFIELDSQFSSSHGGNVYKNSQDSLEKEEYISIEHINFRMRDLLEATSIKKNELEKALETKYHINREELENKRMTNEKMEGLYKEENIVQKEDNHHVLKKTIEPQNIVHNTVNNQNERNKK